MNRPSAPTARRVREAIDTTERMVCGDGAVVSAAVAEGLALAGCRASRVFGIGPAEQFAPRTSLAVGWVDHRVHAAATGDHAFRLVASSAQEAVDHCLVAHRVASRLGRPGLCAVDAALAESVAVTWLPDEAWIADLPQPLPAAARRGDGDPPDADVVAQEALAAFAAVEGATGRNVGPIVVEAIAGADRVLVGVGDGGVVARETAAVLRGVGVACGAVAVTLLEPFPAAALREVLQSVRSITVLGDAGDLTGERLARRVRAALDSERDVGIVPALPGRGGIGGEWSTSGPHVLAALELLWGVDLSEAIVHEPEHVAGARIGAQPGGRFSRNLLLDAVARLGWVSDVRVDCVQHPADDVVAVAVGDGPVHANGPLDLLLVTDPTNLRGEGGMRRVRQGGTVLWCAPRPGAVRLTDAQRAAVSNGGLRLRMTTERAPVRLEAGMLKATSDLEKHGASAEGATDLIGTLVAAIPESLETERLELLAGAAALVDDTPATEEAETAVELPTMPIAAPPDDTAGLDEQEGPEARRRAFRAFHFAGTLGGHGRVARPATPLHTAVFPMPDAAVGVPLLADDRPLLDRWFERVAADRRRRRVDFADDSGALVDRLNGRLGGRLTIDEDAADDGALAAALGDLGSAFVDPSQLREKLTIPGSSAAAVPLPDASRPRVERLLDALVAMRKRIRTSPIAHVLVRDAEDVADRAGIAVTRHDDPLRAAIGLFDGLAGQAIADARSLREARLEAEGDFDEAVHGPQLERLDWPSLRAAERLLAPTVVVVESARRLRGPALAALSELIRSGRAVHVLVTESVTDAREELLDERAGYHPGLGYLMMAHREALVVQTTPGCSAHLAAGLERASTSLEPVVIVAAAASPDLPWPAPVQLEAALRSRAIPCFRYDPGSGVSWAERFALEANPQPDSAWPRYTVAYVDAVGAEGELEEAFTFAHAAALDPGWREHFLVIDPYEWLDDQLPVAEWLELADRERSRALPFLWVVDADGVLARALVRWELAFSCRDRAQAWRLLQELGGTHDVYAERAAEQARREVQQQQAERVSRLDAEHAREVETARHTAAEAAIERLVWAFVDPDGAARVQAAAVSAAQATAPAAVMAPEAGPVEAAAVAEQVVGPYIDSFLCTSCNDCLNLNSRLFVYNDDKQATIGDPSKGTFAELVKAAEVCPARCIHPGTPRPGDKSATPKMIERAARFA